MELEKNNPKIRVWVLFLTTLSNYAGYGSMLALLPFYAKYFDTSAIAIGLLLGVYDFLGVFAPSFWGIWGDKNGRRPALLMNIGGNAIALLMFGLANSLWMLFAARILSGATGSTIVIAGSYVTQYSSPENRTRDLGILESSTLFGVVLGAGISGFLIGSQPENPNYHLPGLIAAGLSALSFCLAFLLLPREELSGSEKLYPEDIEIGRFEYRTAKTVFSNVVEVLKNQKIWNLIIVLLVCFFAQSQCQMLLPLWLNYKLSWGPQEYSYLLVFCALLVGVVEVGLLGTFNKWWGESQLVLWGFAALGVGWLFLPFCNTWPLILVLVIISTWGQGVSNPAIISLIVSKTEASQQGQTLGIVRSAVSLSTFIGIAVGGLLFETIGAAWPYWLSGVVLLVTVVTVALSKILIDPSAESLEKGVAAQ